MKLLTLIASLALALCAGCSDSKKTITSKEEATPRYEVVTDGTNYYTIDNSCGYVSSAYSQEGACALKRRLEKPIPILPQTMTFQEASRLPRGGCDQ